MKKQSIEVFNRHETKYLLDSDIAKRVIKCVSENAEIDKYNLNGKSYPITNIYYDTPDSHLIRTSLSKPTYKEKLRLRVYGTFKDNAMVYVEIKKKCGGVVNKRRSQLLFREAHEFLSSGIIPKFQPYMNMQVLREVEYLLSRLKLQPKVCIAYDRLAFHDTNQPDLRISFDTNIRTKRENITDFVKGEDSFLLDDTTVLMEIKAVRAMPSWLCRLLSAYSIYPNSFSKYGKEYLKTLEDNSAQRIPVLETKAPFYGVIYKHQFSEIYV